MNLNTEIKRKNDELLLKNVVLQQHLHARLNASKAGSFLFVLVVAPFLVGAIVGSVLGSKGLLRLSHIARHILT